MLKKAQNQTVFNLSSPYDAYTHHCWLEVDLEAWKGNIRTIQKQTGVDVLQVIKANAYGHGLVPCALAAEEAGARMLGIVSNGEAALLREAGVKADILRMTAWLPEDLPFLIQNDIDMMVFNTAQILEIQSVAQKFGRKARVQIKVDTGMGRLGAFPDQVLDIAKSLNTQDNINFRGIYSHFHTSEGDEKGTLKQIEIFDNVVEGLKAQSLLPPMVHLANSEGMLRYPQAHYTMVRSGIHSYGVPFELQGVLPEGIKRVAQWKSRIVSIKRLPAGHSVGYSQTYTTKREENIAIIPVGYGDGLRRTPSNINEFIVGGRILKVVGNVCMDQCFVVIPEDLNAKVGDEVVIIGQQGDQEITARQLGNRWGTNRRDVFTGIQSRVPRVYI